MTEVRNVSVWKVVVGVVAVAALLVGGAWYAWRSTSGSKDGRDREQCIALAKEATLKRLRSPTDAKFGGLDAQLNMVNAFVTGFVDVRSGTGATYRNVFKVVFDGPSGGRRVEFVQMERGYQLEAK